MNIYDKILDTVEPIESAAQNFVQSRSQLADSDEIKAHSELQIGAGIEKAKIYIIGVVAAGLLSGIRAGIRAAFKLEERNKELETIKKRDITESCGLAKKKRWRILVGDETHKAVRSRKEDTPCATIPHSMKLFEMKST